jgi:hypothetical protein
VTVYKLLVPAGSMILEHDRVKEVILEDGTTLTDAFTVNAVFTRRKKLSAFYSIDLERVQ